MQDQFSVVGNVQLDEEVAEKSIKLFLRDTISLKLSMYGGRMAPALVIAVLTDTPLFSPNRTRHANIRQAPSPWQPWNLDSSRLRQNRIAPGGTLPKKACVSSSSKAPYPHEDETEQEY